MSKKRRQAVVLANAKRSLSLDKASHHVSIPSDLHEFERTSSLSIPARGVHHDRSGLVLNLINFNQAGDHPANNLITVIQRERGDCLQEPTDIYAEDFKMWKERLPG